MHSAVNYAARRIPSREYCRDYAREHQKERVQFLNVSWGLLAEVGYCLHVARRAWLYQ